MKIDRWTVTISTLAACILAAGPIWAQDNGRRDYAVYCADCHGVDGKGNGPAVQMIPGFKPGDLTQLTKSHGGSFPSDEVYQVIDGRRRVPGHYDWDTDMPLWGLQFQPEGKEFSHESEAKVKRRIDALVGYILSIQQK